MKFNQNDDANASFKVLIVSTKHKSSYKPRIMPRRMLGHYLPKKKALTQFFSVSLACQQTNKLSTTDVLNLYSRF
jgi:hypothetical protein